jgi:hypothetical protein
VQGHECAQIYKERCGENWLQFTAILQRLLAALDRIERENGLR